MVDERKIHGEYDLCPRFIKPAWYDCNRAVDAGEKLGIQMALVNN
jgi:hypothetical protein